MSGGVIRSAIVIGAAGVGRAGGLTTLTGAGAEVGGTGGVGGVAACTALAAAGLTEPAICEFAGATIPELPNRCQGGGGPVTGAR